MRSLRFLTLLLALAPQAALAQEIPPDQALEEQGAVIGEIRIRAQDIFDPADPDEDGRLFRLADRLHRTTRESVIASQLLFKEGDRYSRRVLDESERILRGDRYLYEAEIRPVHYDGNRVDLEVITQDVWTLNVGAGVGRGGGVSSTHFQVQDTNLFGLGKSLTLERKSNVDRTESLFRYDDPGILGSRVRLGVTYSGNSDGRLERFDLARPFYSLDTRWSAGVTALSDDRVDSRYDLGEITGRFRHRQELFELRGGLSSGLHNGWARRWTSGFTFLSDRFEPAGGGDVPDLLPADRTLSYPWIALDLVQDDYRKTRDMDQIHRTEDLFLGGQFHLRLGLSSPVFGADETLGIFDATASQGYKLTADQTLLLSSDLSGRFGSGGAENTVLSGGARYYWRDFGDQLFFATLEGAVATNLDRENQILLGGDNGLRGYPLRYQDGEGRALLTLEQRFFTDYYPFHLLHVGGAVFFDAGRAWGGERDFGLLKDIGVGLRLSSSRSGLGEVIHLDLAFPLDGDDTIKRMQWLVTTKSSF